MMEKQPKEPKGGYIPTRSMFIAKSTLRCLQILFAVLALGLTGSISFGTNIGVVLPFIVVSPCVLLTLIWTIIELLAIKVQDHHRGLPPPAVLSMDLICWLALVGCNAGLAVLGMTSDLRDVITYQWSLEYRQGRLQPWELEEVRDVAYRALAVVAFVSILTALHVSTFSIACYETHMRNREPKPPAPAQQTILVVQNGNGPPTMLGPATAVASGGQVVYQVAAPAPGQQQPGQVYYVPVQAVPVAGVTQTAVQQVQPEYTGVRQHQAVPAVPLIQMAGKKE
ncbi:hypothetical protein B0T16DRAFT_402939 [Cercophora newfieldiana]|uniref:Uncharacterized protein n=1 Tax=Cercophora newfieldiana TaxID=92897 RepID=A0AA40D2E2_9PEZI|nr:hypothetical protein B0T16DRAFT_402939 [Cercophora newfieldiana]